MNETQRGPWRKATCLIIGVFWGAGCGFNADDPRLNLPVVSLATPPPAISGGTLAVLRDGHTAVASDPDNNVVHVVDLTDDKIADVALQPGDEPGRVVQDAAGRVHVVLRGGGALLSLNADGSTERRAVCSSPRGVAYDPAGDVVHVACARGELVTLPAAGGPATRTVQLEPDLRDVAVQNGVVYVSRFRAAEALVLNADGTIARRLRAPDAVLRSVDPDTSTISAQLTQTYSPGVAWRMVASPFGVAMVHQRGLSGPEAEAAVPMRTYGYQRHATAHWVDPCDNAVSHGTVTILEARGTAQSVGAPSIRRGVLPVDVAVSPGGRVAVALAGEFGPEQRQGPQVVVSNTTVLLAGTPGTCVTEDPALRFPGQAVAVAFAANERLVVQLREPAALAVDGRVIALAADPRRDTGHDIFHMNAGGGIACASCHPEGGDDGHVWAFRATGAMRTQPLQGGVLTAERLHWGGEIQGFRDLMATTFAQRMGGAMPSDPQVAATRTWIDALAVVPASPPADPASAARGEAVFRRGDVGCTGCHAGDRMTTDQMQNVGGGMWKVPSLRGLALRAPYLHSGCAQTIAQAFRPGACIAGATHGHTSQLSAAEVGDLVAYLGTL